MANTNSKINALPVNSSPSLADNWAIVNNGVTKKMSISGLTDFLNDSALLSVVTGGTFSEGTATFTNNLGGTFEVTGFTTTSITGGTYDKNTGTITFVNLTGGTFDITGFPKNVRHWVNNETITVDSDETLVISGNYVLNNSTMYLNSADNTISVGSVDFNEYGQIFIGGYLLLIDSDIINNGSINVAGDVILSGTSTITGTGIVT